MKHRGKIGGRSYPRLLSRVMSPHSCSPVAATEDPRNEPVNTSDALSDPDPLADSSSDSDAEKSGGEGTASRGISAEDKLVRVRVIFLLRLMSSLQSSRAEASLLTARSSRDSRGSVKLWVG